MNCPVCNVGLLLSERQGIEIDYCPKCRGIWLDRGELDKIIERSIPQHEKQNSEDILQRKDYQNRETDYRYKKKKGLLGELFDF